MKNYDISIVGAGVVGLATALNLSKSHPDTKICVVEKESHVAKHQTGNNSGVIHSGVYYTPGSLKAQNCKRGYDLLLDFLEEYSIPYELCGKIIVASDESEIPAMEAIYKKGIANGLKNLNYLDVQQIKEVEPYVQGVKAIHVPQAGITNYAQVSRKYKSILESRGVDFYFDHKVIDISYIGNNSVSVITNKREINTGQVINCGGLYSDKLALMTLEKLDYKIVPFRGEYYDLKPHAYHLVNGLIYPVPDPNFPFLGVHFTKTIEQGVESGPNAVFAFSREGYRKIDIDLPELLESLSYSGFRALALKHWRAGSMEMYRSFSKKAYVKSLQKLIPSIKSSDVVPGNAGVRAQALKKDGSMVDDFLILKSPNVINICNAPSPAATSSLAIGEYIADLI